MTDSAPYARRVCVVISSGLVAEDDLRRILGSALPLHFVEWQRRNYLATIEALQPQVIVVMAETGQLAADSALLLMALLDNAQPTIAGLSIDPTGAQPPELIVWQLGLGAGARFASLLDLRLP
jgi:hypothetical protein